MSDESERIARELAALKTLRDNEQIDASIYSKKLVILAAELIDVGQSRAAMQLLKGLARSYLEGELLEQMVSDAIFAGLAIKAAHALVDSGYVTLGDVVAVTMRPGVA